MDWVAPSASTTTGDDDDDEGDVPLLLVPCAPLLSGEGGWLERAAWHRLHEATKRQAFQQVGGPHRTTSCCYDPSTSH